MAVSGPARVAIGIIAAGFLFGLASGGALPARAGTTVAVAIADFAFAPATLTIQVGDTVTWTNGDAVVHTATSTSGAFDSGDLDPGESYSITFTAPGTYDYLCTPHPSMTGRIVVESLTPPTAPPGAVSEPLPNVAMPQPAGSGAELGVLALGVAAVMAIGRRRRRQ
jgi:amicyanin